MGNYSSDSRRLMFGNRMLIQNQHSMWLQVVIAGNVVAGQKVVHRFIKLDAHRRILMVEQEKNVRIFPGSHADLDVFRHFEQRMEIAHLTQPSEEIDVKMLMAERPDVNGFAKAKRIHG